MGATRKRTWLAVAFAVAAALLMLAASACSGAVAAQDERADGAGTPRAEVTPIPDSTGAYVPGELIVGLAEGAEEGVFNARVEAAGFHVESALAHASDYASAMLLVSTGDERRSGEALQDAAFSLARIPGVDFVQPNFRYAASDEVRAADVAADQDVAEQWYLNSWAGAHGANVAAAWNALGAGGARTVDVAVLDTGVYVMQEYDQAGANLVVSADNFHQEFDGANLDAEHGVDFVHSEDNASPVPLVNKANPYGDDNGHGTHVAGIVAANARTASAPGNRAVGMAGVSPVARVIPVKVLDSGGEGSTADFLSAYDYLLGNSGQGGAFANLRVINMSLSLEFDESDDAPEGYADDEPAGDSDGDFTLEVEDAGAASEGASGNTALQRMIQAAEARGIVTVCAAGNEASAAVTYPGDYDECVSVVALDPSGATAAYSNVNEHKDISAPGTGIYSAWGSQADAYATLSGTSQATAIVSGVFSMLWAANPDLTVAQAKAAVYNTAHPVEEGSDRALLRAMAESGGVAVSEGPGRYSALDLQSVANGSHGAIDAAAALDYAASHEIGDSEPSGSSEAISIAKGKATFAKATYTYTGEKLAPVPQVTVGGKALSPKTDYTVKYSGNVNPGTAKAQVSGKGPYTGKLACTFKIALGTTKVTGAKPGKRSATITWARQKSGNVGYQLRYSAKKSMKGATSKLVSKNATTKLKIAKLTSGKRYYVQVRTYKKIGKSKSYSAWSAKKAVKAR